MAFGLLKNLGLINKTPARRNPSAWPDRVFEIDGEQLPVKIVEHATTRRMTLRLMPGGAGLKVTVPTYIKQSDISEFLERNRNWLVAKRARMPKAVVLQEGETILYQGVEHQLVHLDRLRGLIEIKQIAGVPSLIVPGEPQHMQRKLVAFLKREARKQLQIAVARHANSLGVRPGQMRITDTTSRWGSCSSTRTLSFSWRIIMAPPEVLDYLAAHEVAHLREMNHSDRFWSLVRQICPDMERHKVWLKRHGSKLHAIQLGE